MPTLKGMPTDTHELSATAFLRPVYKYMTCNGRTEWFSPYDRSSFGSFPDTLQGVCHISSHQVYFIVPFCSTYFVLSLVPNTSRTPAHLYLTAGLWIEVPRWPCHHRLQRETWAQQAHSLTHGGTVGGGLPRHAASDQLSANIHIPIKLHPALHSCVLHAKGSILTNPST